jgi:hypothetical protein
MSPKDTVKTWVDAFNRADVEGLAALSPSRPSIIRWDKLSSLRLYDLPLPLGAT